MKSLIATLIITLTYSITINAQSWEKANDDGNVTVYTRSLDGWPIKEYKASVLIKTTLDEAVEAYKDPNQRSQWTQRVSEVSILKEVSENEIYTYNLGDAPWPVSDRDAVTHVKFRQESANVVVADMVAAPNFIPERQGVVRVPRSEGYWKFEDKGNGYVEVTNQVVADLGGSVPAWIVNANIVNGPLENLSALKTFLEK